MAEEVAAHPGPTVAEEVAQQPSRSQPSPALELFPHAALVERDDLMPGRGIITTDAPAWTGVQLMEWELTAAEWTDRHPHEEVNHVLAGELHVTCEGRRVVAGPGDTVGRTVARRLLN